MSPARGIADGNEPQAAHQILTFIFNTAHGAQLIIRFSCRTFPAVKSGDVITVARHTHTRTHAHTGSTGVQV